MPGLSFGRCRCRILGKPENPNTVNKVLWGGLNLEATSLWRGPLEKNKGKTGAPRRLKLYLRVTALRKNAGNFAEGSEFFFVVEIIQKQKQEIGKGMTGKWSHDSAQMLSFEFEFFWVM